MRIWHVYLTRSPSRVDGILTVSLALAGGQARLGHEVTVWLAHPGDPGQGAAPADLRASPSAAAALRAMAAQLRAEPPDVAHLHSCFRPPHALLASGPLRRAGVPYVASPHAALAPRNLDRYRRRKAAYGALVERRFLRGAAGLSCLTPVEARDTERYAAPLHGAVAVIANPAPEAAAAGEPWVPPAGRPTVLTLARYDVRQKGLDVLADIARHLPRAEVVVHGSQDGNEPSETDALRRAAPANFRLLPPVHGDPKRGALRSAALFVQPSRWEGLSAALVEALAAGVPCAVSEYVAATLPFPATEVGIVLAPDPRAAARQIDQALETPDRLAAWSAAARAHARRHFAPERVAEQTLRLYDQVLGGRRAPLLSQASRAS